MNLAITIRLGLIAGYRILIAGIRNNGAHPCHRCLVKDSELGNLGAPSDAERRRDTRCEIKQAQLVDKAHRLIHGGQWAVTGKKVEGLVKEESLVPVKVSSFPFSDGSFPILTIPSC